MPCTCVLVLTGITTVILMTPMKLNKDLEQLLPMEQFQEQLQYQLMQLKVQSEFVCILHQMHTVQQLTVYPVFVVLLATGM